MTRLSTCCRSFAFAVIYSGLAASSVHAVLLTNPGFEVNSTTTVANVFSDFNTYQNIWAPENGTIVGVDAGLSPLAGANQMRLDDDGLSATQLFQVVDVSAFTVPINAGAATVNFDAFLNSRAPAAIASVSVGFFSGPNFGTQIGTFVLSGAALDANGFTWQNAAVSSNVPIGTQWIMAQVAYSNVSLNANGQLFGGYVDETTMNVVVPEPSTLALLALGSLSLLRRTRG
jgi:hypothetical protein